MSATLRRALGALAAVFLAVAGIAPATAASGERILDFYSQIQVHADGTMTVTESITVVAAGDRIKRGIYRDFPTRYSDRYGNPMRVGFDVVEVLRDGRPEPYHTKTISDGTRVYIGEEDVFLEPGSYTYALTYRTSRQLGFLEDFDELYWNVTGNGWAFAIERARATVELPRDAPVLSVVGYTGPQGATGTDYTSSTSDDGGLSFVTTRALDPGEGLSIAVTWPKGFVAEPTSADEFDYFVSDNAGVIAGLAGLVPIVLYYLFAWMRVGRDPAKGAIVPLFEPPKGFSPAAMRFVTRMGFDQKAFAAAIVNMAVKGYLTIKETVGGDYAIEKTGAARSLLSPGERGIEAQMFDGSEKIELKNENRQAIGKAIKTLKKSLRGDFEKIYFLRNSRWLIPGLILTLFTIMALAEAARIPDDFQAWVLWLAILTGGCWLAGRQVADSWRTGMSARTAIATLAILPIFCIELVGLWFMANAAGVATVLGMLAIVAVNVLFYELMKAPTLKGRKLMDQIEGFRQYLSVAEKERLGVLNPPDRTPELFEKYLPFALALDVEHEWSEQFAGVLAGAGQGRDYNPGWYSGHSWHGQGATGIADSLGNAFAGAIASSSGGGGAGGGGGGGGGGGW